MAKVAIFAVIVGVLASGQERVPLSNIDLYPNSGSIAVETEYELSLLLPKEINQNSRILIDFSSSDIATPAGGQLATCYYEDVFDPTYQVTYTGCSCEARVCTIQPLNSVSSLYTLTFGPISNPPFVSAQSVEVRIEYSAQYYSLQQVTIPSHIYKPGSIVLDSLQQSSFKVAALNHLDLRITLSHANPGGKLQITFPQDVTFHPNVTAPGWTTTVLAATKKILIEGSLNSNSLQLTLQNTINPEFCGVSTSFLIESLTPDLHLVDSLADGVVVVTNQPEVVNINFVGVYPGQTQIVSQPTVFYFILQPAVKYLSGGWLEIEFPAEITLSSKVVCIKILGMTAEGEYSCTKDGYKVRTQGLYYPNALNQLMMTVSGAVNPGTTRETSSFKFGTFDAKGNLICVSSSEVRYQAKPGVVSVESLRRTESRVSAVTGVRYELTTMNNFDGSLRLRIPGYEILNAGTFIMCEGAVGAGATRVVSCQIEQEVPGESGFTQIKITQLCETKCLKATAIKVSLNQSFKNPAFIYTQPQKLEISTYSLDDFLIDQGSSLMAPLLTPIEVQDLVVTRLPAGVLPVKQDCQLQLQFTIESEYFKHNNGNLVVNLPQDSLIHVAQQCDRCSNQLYDSFQNVKTVAVTQLCQTLPCPDKVTLLLQNLKVGYKSGINTSPVEIVGYSLDNMKIFTGHYDLTLQTSYLMGETKSLEVSEKVTGIKSQYDVTIGLEEPLESVIDVEVVGGQCLSTIDDVIVSCECQGDRVRILSGQKLNGKQMRVSITEVENPFSLRSEWVVVNQLYKGSIVMQWVVENRMEVAREMASEVRRSNWVVSEETEVVVRVVVENEVRESNFKVWVKVADVVMSGVQVRDASGDSVVSQVDKAKKEIVFSGKGPLGSGSTLEFRIGGVRNLENTQVRSNNCRVRLISYDNYDIQDSGLVTLLPQLVSGSIVVTSIQDVANTRLVLRFDVHNPNVDALECSTGLNVTQLALNNQLIASKQQAPNLILQTGNLLLIDYTLDLANTDIVIRLSTYQAAYVVDSVALHYSILTEQVVIVDEELQQTEESQQKDEEQRQEESQKDGEQPQEEHQEEQHQEEEQPQAEEESKPEEDQQEESDQIQLEPIQLTTANRSSFVLLDENQFLELVLSDSVIDVDSLSFQLSSILITGFEQCYNGDVQFSCFEIAHPKSNRFLIKNVTNQVQQPKDQDQVIITRNREDQIISFQFQPLLMSQPIILESIKWKDSYVNSRNASLAILLTLQSATHQESILSISSIEMFKSLFGTTEITLQLNKTKPLSQHELTLDHLELPNKIQASSQILFRLQPQNDSLLVNPSIFFPSLMPSPLEFLQLNSTQSQWNFTISLSIPSVKQQFIAISFSDEPFKEGVSLSNVADNTSCLAKSQSHLECITPNAKFYLQGLIFSNKQSQYHIQSILVYDVDSVITHQLQSSQAITVTQTLCQPECLFCNENQCESCIFGYQLFNNSCQKGCPGYVSNGQCYECPQNCDICDSAFYCRSCEENYQLVQNQCYSKQCDIPHCNYCREKVCIDCKYGYQLDNSICIQPYYNISAIILISLLTIVFIHFIIFAILPPKNMFKLLMNSLTSTALMHTLCILVTLVDRVYYLHFLEVYFLLLDMAYFNVYFGSTFQVAIYNVFLHYFFGGMTFRFPLTNFSKSNQQMNITNYILVRNIHQYKIMCEIIISTIFNISLCWTNILYLISLIIDLIRILLFILEHKYI